MTTTHPALSPTRLADLELPNQLVVAPMTRVSAQEDGVPTQDMVDYYAEYAAGGWGLIITEGIYTDTLYSQGYHNQPGLAVPDHTEGWRRVTQAVHSAGGRIFAQLMHAGALSQGNPYKAETVAPSAVRPRGEMMPEYGGSGPWPTPREMTAEDIESAVQGFADAALAARDAGFDGVEVHAANGYLLDQFLTDYTNHRDDEYGGPVTNRVRIVAEAVARIRKQVGDEFPLGVRLSQGKVNDSAYRWPDGARTAEAIFTAVAGVGASHLHVASEGRDWIESARLDGGATVTGLARRVTGLPVIANGGMHDPGQAARVLDDGHADLLSLGRGALANPDYPRRLASGEPLAAFDHGMLEPFATLANARRRRADGERGR
ncbi:NADH:flavin oxidoreductase [Actinomadura sp. NBRC 104412]|uniref:NADH:flavin oxidoreductase n=1 Tax=Actinomadura sp. NBRC 104412 TaxID=3032203 RepID=UPI0024A5C126|nr:NADH:flavin oxidoreductase [Actinomadura sp. NBRC 104412]GLZ02639.1 NADH:flavin oxidoreductase [Actinomadura sp. NBRC 104412]